MWKLSAAEGNHRQDEVGATGEAPTREKQDITDVISSTNRLFTNLSTVTGNSLSFLPSQNKNHDKKMCTIIWL